MRFADTSFWVALILRRDRHHDEAARLWAQRDRSVMVTNHVLGEVWTFLRRRDGHDAAKQAHSMLVSSDSVELVPVDENTEDEAWSWLERHDERSFSFVDATSFAVMRQEGILEALAFDGAFSAAGFVEVRAP